MSYSDELLKGIRTRLLLSYPFFGSAIADYLFQESSRVKRIYCNGTHILYNPDFVRVSPPNELAYWLCREILHLTMDYVPRKKKRSNILWAISAEYAVNSILAREGLTSGVHIKFYRRNFSGKSTEEIYSILVRESITDDTIGEIERLDDLIQEHEKKGDLSDNIHDFSQLARAMKLRVDGFIDLIEEARERSREYGKYKAKTLEMIAKAKLSQRTVGKIGFTVDLPIEQQPGENLRWEDLLSNYAVNDRESHSYRRFQRKYVSSEIYLPQRYHMFQNLIICVDVSASIDDTTLGAFLSEVIYLISSRSDEISVRLIQTDAQIQSDVTVDPAADPKDILRRRGFGGTDFTALFRLLEIEDNRNTVIIFTDGRAKFPEKKPEGFDVIWITTDLKMPWGINMEYGEELESEYPH